MKNEISCVVVPLMETILTLFYSILFFPNCALQVICVNRKNINFISSFLRVKYTCNYSYIIIPSISMVFLKNTNSISLNDGRYNFFEENRMISYISYISRISQREQKIHTYVKDCPFFNSKQLIRSRKKLVLGLYFTTFVTKIIELCIRMKNRRLLCPEFRQWLQVPESTFRRTMKLRIVQNF